MIVMQASRREDRLKCLVFEAVTKGDVETVRDLMDKHGTRAILSQDLLGQTVLQAAVDSGQEEMLIFLLEDAGATDQINEILWNGDTVLHQAIERGQRMEDIVRVLLKFGADPTIEDRNGLCALKRAFLSEKAGALKLLITHGDNPARTVELAGRYLEMAEQHGMNDMVAALSDLLEAFDVDDPEFNLYSAIINNDQRTLVQLFFQRVDPFAVRFGQKKMSALHAAARQSDIRVLSMLLARVDRMGRVDAVDKNGQTPLHYAAIKNSADHVDWLVFVGADPYKKDKEMVRPEDLATSRKVEELFDVYWNKIPDAIILMHGDWCEKLPRTLCTLSRSVQQPLDPVLPPVLAFRCVTEDDINAVNDEFHESSFEAEETCVEVYEYRCSNPVVLVIAVDVKGYDYDPHRSSLFFLCIDDVGEIVDKIQLTVSDDREGSCDVEVLKKGQLVLVHRRKHLIATVSVGRDERLIRPDNIPGFEIEMPRETFQQDQQMLIKSEEPRLLRQEYTNNTRKRQKQKVSEAHLDQSQVASIKNASCFYTITNSANEKPSKSLRMNIPFGTKPDNRVVTLIMKGIQSLGARDDGQRVATETEAAAYPSSPPASPVSRQPVLPSAAGGGGADPVWRLIDDVSVAPQRTTVSTDVRDMDVCVVAVEVKPDMENAKIIDAVQQLYTRRNKNQILIFAMAKPYPGNGVEVMICCVSEEIYDVTVTKLKEEGYVRLRQPIVAYAINREIFSLNLKGNFRDMYMDKDPVLEYQVGGRLNHTTFVLQLKKKRAEALGAIKVSRRKPQDSTHSDVGIVHLELTGFFQKQFTVPRGGRRFRTDELVLALSEELSTDHMRVYCYALGLTKDVVETICKSRAGDSLSPTEKNYQMLSATRSQFRSEAAFRSHLTDVLRKHKDRKALKLLKKILGIDTL